MLCMSRGKIGCEQQNICSLRACTCITRCSMRAMYEHKNAELNSKYRSQLHKPPLTDDLMTGRACPPFDGSRCIATGKKARLLHTIIG